MDPVVQPFQPEAFTTPEGLYIPSPTHFLPTYVPVPIAGNPLPPIPVRMVLTEIRYPPRKEGTGFGGLLGLGGTKDSLKEESADGESTTSDDPTGSSGAPSEQLSSSVPDMLAPTSPNATNGALSTSFVSSTLSASTSPPFGSVPSRTGFLSRPTNGGGGPPHPRPRNSLRSTSSSFVTRIQSPESSVNVLASRSKTGETVTWGFWHYGRTLGWVELGGKTKEPIARITFSQQISTVAVQELGKSHERMDAFLGFGTGDLVWFGASCLPFDPVTRHSLD